MVVVAAVVMVVVLAGAGSGCRCTWATVQRAWQGSSMWGGAQPGRVVTAARAAHREGEHGAHGCVAVLVQLLVGGAPWRVHHAALRARHGVERLLRVRGQRGGLVARGLAHARASTRSGEVVQGGCAHTCPRSRCICTGPARFLGLLLSVAACAARGCLLGGLQRSRGGGRGAVNRGASAQLSWCSARVRVRARTSLPLTHPAAHPVAVVVPLLPGGLKKCVMAVWWCAPSAAILVLRPPA